MASAAMIVRVNAGSLRIVVSLSAPAFRRSFRCGLDRH